MATLALIGLNAALSTGGGLGLFAGNQILTSLAFSASVAVDSLFVFPALFKKDPVEGSRLNDLQIQATQEGSPASRLLGNSVRASGTVIWQTALREVKDEESGGGKGGSGGSYLTYKYFTNTAIEFARTRRNEPVAEFLEIYADGKLFWSAEPDFVATSNQISAIAEYQSGNSFFESFPGRTEILFISDTAGGGPDLSNLQSGRRVAISGFTDGHDYFAGGGLTATGDWLAGAPQIDITSSVAGTLSPGDTLAFANHGYNEYYITEEIVFEASSTRSVRINRDGTSLSTTLGLAGDVDDGELITANSNASRNNSDVHQDRGSWKVLSSQTDTTNGSTSVRILIDGLLSSSQSSAPGGAVVAGTKGAGDTISIFQESPSFAQTQAQEVRFYPGTREQEADPLIREFEEGVIGAGNIPAFRNKAYMVVEDLELTDFGNRLPNFEAVISVDPNPTTASAIRQTLLDAGYSEEEFDVSRVTTDLGGFIIRGAKEPKSSLQPILIAKQVVSWQDGPVLRFADRSGALTITLAQETPDGSLPIGAQAGNSEPRPLKVRESGDIKDVREVIVKHYDPDLNYQTGAKRSFSEIAFSTSVDTVDTQVVMSGNEAQRLADTLLAQLGSGRKSVSFTLPPSFVDKVHESQVVNINNVYGRNWTVILTRVEFGANMLIRCEGREEDPEALIQLFDGENTQASVVNTGGSSRTRATSYPSEIVAVFADVPVLQDAQAEQPGLYVGAVNAEQRIPWRGASIYESHQEDTNYRRVQDLTVEAVIGRLITAPLGTDVIRRQVIDRGSAVQIETYNSLITLSSVTCDEMLKGRNRFLIGGEIIGAADVTLISTDLATGRRVWELSTLLRGLKDTYDQMDNHGRNEQVMWLDGPGVSFLPMSASEIGQLKYYKAIPNGGAIEDSTVYEVTMNGKTVAPFRPVQITGERDGSNNLTIRWEHALRRSQQVLNQIIETGQPASVGIASEIYRVRILSGPGSDTALREFTVTSSGSATREQDYTASQQTTDSITPGDPVTVEIVQISPQTIEGSASEETV